MASSADRTREGRVGAAMGTTPLLTLSVACTIGALVWFGVTTLLTNRDLRQQYTDLRTVEQLRGEIVYLDEVLTMSARMAAATGEPRWTERHEHHLGLLEAALGRATTLTAGTGQGTAADATSKANDALTAIERQALQLVRAGKTERARALLGSDDYEQQKQAYAESIRRFALSRRRDAQLDRLRGAIVYYDEVLTMCAYMAAATGELKWQARYRSYRARLEEALFDALELSQGSGALAATSATGRANEKLVALEQRAFELVRQGRAGDARELLESADYRTTKDRYAAGMTELAATLRAEAQAVMGEEARAAWRRTAAAITLGLLLLLGWVFVTVRVRTKERQLVVAGQALLEQTQQLSRDVAARQRAERELQQNLEHLQKTQDELVRSRKLAALGGMAAGVAHEINNPLSGVLGIASMLLQDGGQPRDPARLRQDLETIQRSAERCRDIVAKLLAFSRNSGGQRAWVALADVVDETLRLVRATMEGRDIQFVADIEVGLRTWGNPTELHQVLMNLVSNAADAIHAGGRVLVKARSRADGGVHMEVRDNGAGIPEEHQGRIFDPFFTTKPLGQGTGLGLSVVHGLVQEHGGSIRLDSSSSGTTFVVDLPPGPETDHSERPAPTQSGFAARSLRVLVVDDDDLVREVVRQMIEQPLASSVGSEAHSAPSPATALDLLRRGHWDVLVTDYRMAEHDGLQLARAAKEIHPHLKVVLMSGQADHLRDSLPNVDAVLAKPPRLQDVHAALRGAFETGSDARTA